MRESLCPKLKKSKVEINMKNMKKIIFMVAIAMNISVFANYKSSYQEMTWDEVKKRTIDKIEVAKKKQSKNLIYKLNSRIKEIESAKKAKFEIIAPKVVDIWLRESYTVLENDYIIKNAPVWKKVLIKQKNIWDI